MAITITRNERTANAEENIYQLYVRISYTCEMDGRYVKIEPRYFASRDAYKQGYSAMATSPIGDSLEFFDAVPNILDIHERMKSKFLGLSYDVEISDL